MLWPNARGLPFAFGPTSRKAYTSEGVLHCNRGATAQLSETKVKTHHLFPQLSLILDKVFVDDFGKYCKISKLTRQDKMH